MMSKATLPVTISSPRHGGVIVRALSIDKYAYELMQEMAPTRKSYGNFLSALILAEHARRQARQQRFQQDRATMEG
jgi:hypothetical protein